MDFIHVFRKRLSLTTIFLSVLLITSIRIFFDFWLLEYPIELDLFGHYARFYLENVFYFMIVFFVVIFFLSKLTRQNFVDVANFGIRIFPIAIIPPIIDHVFFGRVLGYSYATTENFWYNFLTISWIKGDASIGISLEITITALLIAAYVWHRSKSIPRTIAAAVLLIGLLVIISTPELFFADRADYVYSQFLPSYYYIPSLIMVSLLMLHYNKEMLKAILLNLRLERALFFVLFVFLGAIAASRLDIPIHWYETCFAATSIFFVWQFSVVINDIYDKDIDAISNKGRPLPKGVLLMHEYRLVAIVFSAYAMAFSAIVNGWVFLLCVTGLLVSIFYSVPPIRLRKNLLGNALIGVALIISFVTGLMVDGNLLVLLSQKNVLFAVALGIVASMVTLTKDLKDSEGDSKHHIKNIITIYGTKKGKNIISIIVFVVLTIPPLLFREFILVPISILFGLAAALIYYKKESEKVVYAIATLVMIIDFQLYYF